MEKPELENKNGEPEMEEVKPAKREKKIRFVVRYPYQVAGVRYGGTVEMTRKEAEYFLQNNILKEE